ncbi:cysteine desulfurase family protein [Sphingobacterium sp.]|uniref:cysteine desulfurase family protein n=1 Tax=Sphingobacterium sp. TaxID=341027 RepID=UPI0028A7F908|nr:cysteine desulfurase family protein [Sphingobacterium sp.]
MDYCYFDNNATTKIDNQVFEAMLPYLKDSYGNASSVQHKLGRQANHAVEKARLQIAELLNVNPKEIYFSSGSTESINTVIKGISKAYQSKGNHIITSNSEHKAVLSSCHAVEKEGMQVSYLKVNKFGIIDLEELKNTITDKTVLISIMAANNETGVLQPIEEIAKICLENDVLFFCDATQWIGKLPLDLSKIPIDIICLSAHKIHGPKGIGALYIRRKTKPTQIPAMIVGGKQESGFRGGTYAVHQIVGLGEAAKQVNFDHDKVEEVRDYFEKRLLEEIEESEIKTLGSSRLPNSSNIHIKHVKATELMTKLPTIAISSGSACVSGDRDPSHVLKAMGYTDDEAYCSLRFSFSKYNSKAEIDYAIPLIKAACESIRKDSPIWEMYKEGLI